jgi:hypothetical protein
LWNFITHGTLVSRYGHFSIVWDTSITTQVFLTRILEVSVPIFCFLGCVCCRAMLHSAFDLFLSSWVASRDRKVI